MNLRKFEGKRIRLTNVESEVFEGRVEDYTYPEDNEPEGVESITLYDCPQRNYPVEFYAPDIRSIEII